MVIATRLGRTMRTRIRATDASGDPSDPHCLPNALDRVRERRLTLPVVASALLLAALGSCDADPVVEPEPSLQIVPDSVTLTHIGHQFTFSVRGGGAVQWNSRDLAVFTVNADGTVTARGNGEARVQAWTPQSSDHALVRVRQAAAVVEAIGSGQRTTPGQPLLEPVGVRLLDAGGVPIPEAAVRFEPARGSGRVDPTEATTDSAGMAGIVWTLGPTPGRQTLRAVAAEEGTSTEIEATALDPDEAAASLEVLAGEDQWALAGHALPDTVMVRVADEFGRPVWGATVRFEPEAGSGRADPATAATDSLGLASVVWTLGKQLGTQRLAVSVAKEMTLAFEATAVSGEGVCNRTPAVSAEIVNRVVEFHRAQVAGCEEVTEELLGKIDLLYLSRKGIRRLGSGDFAGIVALEVLHLNDNELTQLPAGVFDGLPQLRLLDLDGNQLLELPPGSLANLNSLQILYLDNNRLSELPPEIFSDLSRLRNLSLSSNELVQLPPDIFKDLSGLKALHLNNNRLTGLSDRLFDGLSNLELLSMGSNELALLPEDIFSGLSRLDYLAVGNNRLTELAPRLFSQTPALRHVALDRNQLTDLSPGLFSETPALQRLFLQDNRLTRLPPGVFDRLPMLFRLDLSRNELALLPPGLFAETPKLAELSLELNELAKLPPGLFAGLSKLEWVTLDSNPGAPFPVQPEFARVDDSDRLAAGPATLVARVPVGAPFAFDVSVSVQRGTISRDLVSMLVGDTVGTAFEVSASAEAGAVHVGFEPLSSVVPAGYSGLRLARGEELVLFAETDNRSPVALSPIPPHRLQAAGPSAELPLNYYFDDPDGDSLAYAVAMTESGVVAARIEAGVLWLNPRTVDTTEVVVTATDPEGLRATQRFRSWVVPAPDPDAFNIELHFEPGFTEEEVAVIRRAADRWMEVVRGDLPDVPVRRPLSQVCFDGPSPPRVVGVIDDLLINMKFAARIGRNLASAAICGQRESGQGFLGKSSFALWRFRDPDQVDSRLYEVALHEIGHVMGFGRWAYNSSPPAWRALFRDRDGDGHFIGPLAVAAFDAAGGESYSGGKVPLEDRVSVLNIHWRKSVIPGDVMSIGVDSRQLTAITIQAMADLGYEVDVSKADPYTLPRQAQGDVRGAATDAEGAVAELWTDEVIKVPVVVVDGDGKVVTVIRP